MMELLLLGDPPMDPAPRFGDYAEHVLKVTQVETKNGKNAKVR